MSCGPLVGLQCVFVVFPGHTHIYLDDIAQILYELDKKIVKQNIRTRNIF